MIYDSVMYFGEDDLLEIRMEELRDIVDKFVITESTITFRGKPKEMYFHEDRFDKYKDKMIYLIADLQASPDTLNAVTYAPEIEYAQRDYFVKCLEIQDDDIFIINDMDEIPRAAALKHHLNNMKEYKICKFIQSMHYYYVNYISVGSTQRWYGSAMVMGDMLKSSMPSSLRRKCRSGRLGRNIHYGGWHFSYLGGPEKIREKIRASAHIEYDKEEIYSLENIARCMETGDDMYNRGMKFVVDNNRELPKYLMENRDKFSHLFYRES